MDQDKFKRAEQIQKDIHNLEVDLRRLEKDTIGKNLVLEGVLLQDSHELSFQPELINLITSFTIKKLEQLEKEFEEL